MKKLKTKLMVAAFIVAFSSQSNIQAEGQLHFDLGQNIQMVDSNGSTELNLLEATDIMQWGQIEVSSSSGVFVGLTGNVVNSLSFDLETVVSPGYGPKLQFWCSDFAVVVTDGETTFSHAFVTSNGVTRYRVVEFNSIVFFASPDYHAVYCTGVMVLRQSNPPPYPQWNTTPRGTITLTSVF